MLKKPDLYHQTKGVGGNQKLRSVRRAFTRKAKMTNYVSLLLESDAAKRRLSESFEPETLRPADYRWSEIVPPDRSRATRTSAEDNNNPFRKYRCTRTAVSSRTRAAIRPIESGQARRDLTVSGFLLAVVLAVVVAAAHTENPVFWLLIGPTPFAVLHTTRTFLRQRVIRREGLLTFCKRDRWYHETLLTRNSNPIGAIAQALTPGSNSKHPNSASLGRKSLCNASRRTSINACGETIRSTPSVEVLTK